MRRFVLALGSLALATFASAPALADCLPGTGLCASAAIGAALPAVQVAGQIAVGLPPIPNIVFPTPAMPLPGYAAPPQGQAPPGGYAQPEPRRVVYARPAWGASKLGVDLRLNGAAGFGANRYGDAYGLGGAGLGLRYRAVPHLGFEGGFDVLGGRDFNDHARVELIGSAGGLLFFNPHSRAQVYLSGGMMLDHARATDDRGLSTARQAITHTHLGGYAGLGLEIFATRRLAFHLDGRGVVRQRVGGNTDAPEFVEAGTGRTTNTSAGFVGSAGVVLYF